MFTMLMLQKRAVSSRTKLVLLYMRITSILECCSSITSMRLRECEMVFTQLPALTRVLDFLGLVQVFTKQLARTQGLL